MSQTSKILVVDDAQFVRNRIKKIIDQMKFAEVVGEASNGVEAISLYKKLNPDLVTMDLVMPEKDGINAIEEIIKFDKTAKIVVVSAMGQELSILEATEKGAKDYIKKPFKDDDVYTVIERLLKKNKK
ncbi:MAG: response regulator [Promethearchaeota archaeon]|jgi:two-component system chemotaxis response regulator CheY